MWFECKVNDSYYKVLVQDFPEYWTLTIDDDDGNSTAKKINKQTFRYVDHTYSLIYKNASHWIDIQKNQTSYTVYCKGSYRKIDIFDEHSVLRKTLLGESVFNTENTQVIAEMPGQLSKVFVKKGDTVSRGQPLVTLEAMKMENELTCHFEKATVQDVHFKEGDALENGDIILNLKSIT